MRESPTTQLKQAPAVAVENLDSAAVAASESNNTASIQIVGFHLGREEYGLDIMKVQEIILPGTITELVQVPDYVRGLINLRGQVLPVLDLRKAFGLPELDGSEDQRIVIAEVGEQAIGIVVDSVTQVLRVGVNELEAPPTTFVSGNTTAITGLVRWEDRMVILLDLERLVSELDTRELAAIGAKTEAHSIES